MLIAGRCGSTWLGDLIFDLKIAGAPHEWFNTPGMHELYRNRQATSMEDYVRQIAAIHPVFGVQIDYMRIFHLAAIIDIERTFAQFAYIDMRRKDFVAQAFSFARAQASGEWHNRQDAPEAVDGASVIKQIEKILSEERKIDAWYQRNAIEPTRLVYEDLIDDIQYSVSRVFDAISIGTPPTIELPVPRQQRNFRTQESDDEISVFRQQHQTLIARIESGRTAFDLSEFERYA